MKKYKSNQSISLRKKYNRETRKIKSNPNLSYKTPNTPRKNYANTYLHEPIYILDNINDDNNIIFQVPFNMQQFEKYVNLSNINDKERTDCVYQSLFALGLINVKNAKLNSKYINKKKYGIDVKNELKKYLIKSFGLNINNINVVYKQNYSFDDDDYGYDLTMFLYDYIKNNYATIITIKYNDYDAHTIVSFKFNDIIYYFDPQYNILSTEIKDITDTFIGIYYYEMSGLTHIMPLLKNTYDLMHIS
jgi:hypothetical protein